MVKINLDTNKETLQELKLNAPDIPGGDDQFADKVIDYAIVENIDNP